MISPVHQQRQRSTSKPQANKHNTKKKPKKTTEHLAKKQQRARETSKFKIQETSRLSIRNNVGKITTSSRQRRKRTTVFEGQGNQNGFTLCFGRSEKPKVDFTSGFRRSEKPNLAFTTWKGGEAKS